MCVYEVIKSRFKLSCQSIIPATILWTFLLLHFVLLTFSYVLSLTRIQIRIVGILCNLYTIRLQVSNIHFLRQGKRP